MEVWKDIDGYEGSYQVSDLGRVRSVDRKRLGRWGAMYLKKGRVLKTDSLNTAGYRRVGLSSPDHVRHYQVHQLVAITFLGHTLDSRKIVVDHIDHNKLNNRLDNIQVITQSENVLRALEHKQLNK